MEFFYLSYLDKSTPKGQQCRLFIARQMSDLSAKTISLMQHALIFGPPIS